MSIARYVDSLPHKAELLAKSMMCPEQFKDKPTEIAIIGEALADCGIRLSITTLPLCYVVHGRPGYFAQLQIGLAARHGCDIVPLDDESDDKTATVKVLGKDRQWHRVTVTMADAVKAGWPGRNPNYRTMPDRMLMARAVTKAIGMHCPEAKFALPAGDLEELPIDVASRDTPPALAASLAEETGEVATDTERRTFYEALRHLDPDVRRCAHTGLAAARIPPPKDPALTSAQAHEALRLIWSAVDEAAPAPDDSPTLFDEPPADPDDEPIDAEVEPPTGWAQDEEPFE